jgi:hypothetical protein
MTLEPGGTVLLAVWPVTAATAQGGIAIVSGLCCLGTTTSLTPGFWSAVATGSVLELDELPPQAASSPVATPLAKHTTTGLAMELAPLMIPPGSRTLNAQPFCCRLMRRRRILVREGGYPAAGSANRNRRGS